MYPDIKEVNREYRRARFNRFCRRAVWLFLSFAMIYFFFLGAYQRGWLNAAITPGMSTADVRPLSSHEERRQNMITVVEVK